MSKRPPTEWAAPAEYGDRRISKHLSTYTVTVDGQDAGQFSKLGAAKQSQPDIPSRAWLTA